jgi:predicted Fe-Mo cluster-binding NifX family protein
MNKEFYMKIAFPSQENNGLVSPVYSHFGSARFFIIVDSDTGTVESLENGDIDHVHGNCQPLKALGNTSVDAVVVGGIGGGALRKLSSAGITTYRAVEGTVSENLELIKSSKIKEFSMAHTCSGHGINGTCIH